MRYPGGGDPRKATRKQSGDDGEARRGRNRGYSGRTKNARPITVVSNILKRLSAKTLTRFQMVSKSWRKLIGSASFMEDHLAHGARRLLYLSNPSRSGQTIYAIDDGDCRRDVKLPVDLAIPPLTFGSSRGTLCLGNFKTILIWNPFNGSFLSFQDTDYVGNYGFAYCPRNLDFLIVKVLPTIVWFKQSKTKNTSFTVKVETFGLKTCSWGKFESISSSPFEILTEECGKVLDDCLYWRAHYNAEAKSGNFGGIVGLNLQKETFFKLSLPLKGVEVEKFMISDVGSGLCASHFLHTGNVLTFWVIKQNDGAWQKMGSVRPPSEFGVPSYYTPLAISSSGNSIFVMMDGHECLELSMAGGVTYSSRSITLVQTICQSVFLRESMLNVVGDNAKTEKINPSKSGRARGQRGR